MSSFERQAFADQLSIETPEQVELHLPLAGIGSRFVAVLVDHLLQIAAIVVLGLGFLAVVLLSGHNISERLAGKWFLAGGILLGFLIVWGYFAVFEAYWNGQTPGKRLMKLRVIQDSGRQITLFEALARNLLRAVDYAPGLYLVGVITMLANRRNKRLGDLAAGTLVVHERSDEQPLLWTGTTAQNAPWQPAPAAEPLVSPDLLRHLGPRDLAVIEAFFARALDLSPEVRDGMATRILRELSGRMNTPVPESNPERALERLAVQLRAAGRAPRFR